MTFLAERQEESRLEQATAKPGDVLRRPHPWSLAEYDRLSSEGSLGTSRTELIGGEIYDVLAQNDPHILGISRLGRVLYSTFEDDRYLVTIQATVRLGDDAAPEPDGAVQARRSLGAMNAIVKPLLIAEVSDDSLAFDRVVKASLYASHAIADYWIVNLKERQVEVYREPKADVASRFGWRYDAIKVYQAGETISPLIKPGAAIDVSRLLP